jgi:hypothetical protein
MLMVDIVKDVETDFPRLAKPSRHFPKHARLTRRSHRDAPNFFVHFFKAGSRKPHPVFHGKPLVDVLALFALLGSQMVCRRAYALHKLSGFDSARCGWILVFHDTHLDPILNALQFLLCLDPALNVRQQSVEFTRYTLVRLAVEPRVMFKFAVRATNAVVVVPRATMGQILPRVCLEKT